MAQALSPLKVLNLPRQPYLYRERADNAVLTDWSVNWNDLISTGDVNAQGTSATVAKMQRALNSYCSQCRARSVLLRRFEGGKFVRAPLVENGVFNASTMATMRAVLNQLGYTKAQLTSPQTPFPNTPSGWARLVQVLEDARLSKAGC